MLTFLGLMIAWPIVIMVSTMLVNIVRVRLGLRLTHTDPVTVFMQGVMFGPIALLAAGHPSSQGKAWPMILGGINGTVGFLYLYNSL